MADVRISVTKEAPGRPLAKSRLLFIDNIRWSMIILVLSMHAADTYSPVSYTHLTLPTILRV